MSWLPVASGVPATTATSGAYTGPMPATATTQALMRVSPAGNAADGDVSNVPFTLAPAAVTVTAPNTNVLWAVGSSQNINWTHNLGTAASVGLEISRDGGATWAALAGPIPNTGNTSGTFAWTVDRTRDD